MILNRNPITEHQVKLEGSSKWTRSSRTWNWHTKMLVAMLIGVAVDIDEWMIMFSTRINELNVVVDVMNDGCEHSRWQVKT